MGVGCGYNDSDDNNDDGDYDDDVGHDDYDDDHDHGDDDSTLNFWGKHSFWLNYLFLLLIYEIYWKLIRY